MSIFDDMKNNLGAWIGSAIAPYLNDEVGVRGKTMARYYSGDHTPQLKNRQNKDGTTQNDNVIQNFTGLIANRSVSRLFRGGLEWELPEGSDAQKEYLDRVWELNKKPITLMQFGLWGAVNGTPYMKILPDALIDPYTGKAYPSLVVLDSDIVRIKTDPQDMTEVDEYRITYVTREEREGRMSDIVHIEVIRKSQLGDYVIENDGQETPDTWQVEEFEKVGSAPIELVRKYEFPFNFPPIHHCKNLPSIKTPYGASDYDDVIGVQDKSNFISSNIGKIIKHHASQRPVVTGASAKQIETVDDSPDSMICIPSVEAKVGLLNGQSDLTSSRLFQQDLQNSIFSISREVDPASIAANLGNITNFGLRVWWLDAIDKNDTKRQLYGDAILEINRRLLVMAGYELEKSNPGSLQWGEALPVNIVEEITTDEKAMNMGIIDKETVAKRYKARYGVDWETIQANIAAQKRNDNATNNNVGAEIFRRFNQGQ